MAAGEEKKKHEILGPPPLWAPHPSGPTPGAPTLRAEALPAPTFSWFGPLRSSFCHITHLFFFCAFLIVSIFFFFEIFTVFVFVCFFLRFF